MCGIPFAKLITSLKYSKLLIRNYLFNQTTSIVNIIVALESMRINFSIVVALDLNNGVVELVLAAAQVCNLTQRF